mgnify:CR=1 FL=1
MLFTFQKIKRKEIIKTFLTPLLSLIAITVFSYWAVKPLFISGFFPTHDDTAPSRVYEMAKALSYGQIPPRWVPDLGYGYGYPLFNFYAPLPYYLGGVLNLFGVSAIFSTKIMFLVGILLSGFSMYFFIKEFSNEIVALAVATVYIYVPYHAVNIYVRGAVGEYYAYGFLPILFLGIYKILINKDFKKGLLVCSLGLCGILLSHNILGLITGYFLLIGLFFYFIYVLFTHKSFQIFYFIILAIFLGFSLSAFFTIPAIFEKKYTKVESLTKGGSDYHNHFVYARQLWDSPWGYGGSAKGEEDGMSFKIGKIQIVLGTLGLIIFLYFFKKNKKDYIFFCFLISILLLSIFFMLQESLLLWELLPGFSYIQYPWRFLNYAGFCFVVFISFIFLPFKKRWQIIISIGIIFITLWFSAKYFSPQQYLLLKDHDYTSDLNLRYKISKISDEYLPNNFPPINSPQEIAEESLSSTPEVNIKKIKDEPTFKKYDMYVANPTTFITKISFFPRWRAFIDNEEVDIKDNNGRIQIFLPEGQYQLKFVFTDTLLRKFANTISVLAAFLLVYVSLFWKIVTYDKKKNN